MTRNQLVVLGCPGHRRVTLFAAAARAAGRPEPAVLPWADLLRGRYELPPGAVVRLDSPGEDPEADRLLRGPVLGPGYAPTRVEGGPAWYAGVTAALRGLAARPGVRLLGDPDEIAVMFDKRRTHALLAAAGVPVPPALPGEPPSGFEELKERLAEAGMRRVFLKPVHGSSASGVVALEFGPGGRVQATTSVELTADGLHNSLAVRRYRSAAEVAELVDRLAPEGLHVERWVPKSGQHGRAADLRVLVVGGRATHAVVRTSLHPMTNLHLGGARGETALARAAAGEHWPELLATAEAAARCFPHAPMVGVDLLPHSRWRRSLVAEVNAFGDLLPNLPGLPEGPAPGLDTYAAQLASPAYAPRSAGNGGARSADGALPERAPASGSVTTRSSTGSPFPEPLVSPASIPDMNEVVGSHDLLLVTLDTLRHDVAAELLAAGRLPNLAKVLPPSGWERRHSPGSFTYAAHQAILAGFLPTPASPDGPHPRLFAARFAGSETTGSRTWVFDAPDLPTGLAGAGYRTVCIGGVGFFNKQGPLGSVLPGLFQESHWAPELGVPSPTSFESQVAVAERVAAEQPPGRPLFLFLNVSALHQPNWFHLPGATRADGDSRETHAAALEYVDAHVGRLFAAMSARRPCFAIVCSDHGTAYGEDGYTGHRIGHEVVWTVPYAHFTLPVTPQEPR
ncbi:hypothetical protein Kpho01_55390 [Kitasatospora phosalacinea]|uniref:ATP-grasp domain-containing protein n=2 Tax=Kitasatospora phosalacinea TaxID=2065 RepID=A0A9W6PMH1_9ACTN|nr:hypothetical protein Kpho01_55390 [Kitasatospora phosalacinea]